MTRDKTAKAIATFRHMDYVPGWLAAEADDLHCLFMDTLRGNPFDDQDRMFRRLITRVVEWHSNLDVRLAVLLVESYVADWFGGDEE